MFQEMGCSTWTKDVNWDKRLFQVVDDTETFTGVREDKEKKVKTMKELVSEKGTLTVIKEGKGQRREGGQKARTVTIETFEEKDPDFRGTVLV